MEDLTKLVGEAAKDNRINQLSEANEYYIHKLKKSKKKLKKFKKEIKKLKQKVFYFQAECYSARIELNRYKEKFGELDYISADDFISKRTRGILPGEKDE